MARAMRRAWRSSPWRRSTSVSSPSPTRASHAAADLPRSGSMRMSSGPSRRKLKPRSGWSSWGEDTPRSSRTPATGSAIPCAPSRLAMAANDPCSMVNRGSAAWRLRPSLTACGSLSMPTSRPAAPSRASSARLCPPRPKVPSMYNPLGSVSQALTAGSSMTGLCSVPTGFSLQRQRQDFFWHVVVFCYLVEPVVPVFLIPQFQLLALPHQHQLFFQPGIFPQRGRQQHPPVAIDGQRRGVTQQQPLHAPSLGLDVWQLFHLGHQFQPVGFGVDQQTALFCVGGDDNAAAARLGKLFANPLGNGDAPLGVHVDGVAAE